MSDLESKNKANLTPAKKFFVDMLTRDIDLVDAILDLIDNCLDGATRSGLSDSPDGKYVGYEAEINFDGNFFEIKDNCGGIPRKIAEESAFRLGRANDKDPHLPTVGVYGIGMKRAMFKMGYAISVSSKTKEDGFMVSIDKAWMDNDSDWYIPMGDYHDDDSEPGTDIKINDLRAGIDKRLGSGEEFEAYLVDEISKHYAFIINQGFSVKVNGRRISPAFDQLSIDMDFRSKEKSLMPYIYKTKIKDVDVTLCVGFYRPLISDGEEENVLEGTQSSKHKAGWTIICNDRVVLYADKTRVTGWGESGVPNYHSQFISIAGFVEFKSSDPSQLPLTTTKRGIDGNSDVYLAVKEYMREGLKTFTSFTNKWKKTKYLDSEYFPTSSMQKKSKNDIVDLIQPQEWTTVRRGAGGQVFRPSLPVPTSESGIRQIRFSKKITDIQLLSEHFFDDSSEHPSAVGEACFDELLRKVKGEA